jgi:DNA polymerase I-like protein with 3'-5' exonuclease and polymerase domains
VRSLSLEALESVWDLLRDPKVLKLGQNVRFECVWTQFHFGCKIRHVWDTQVAEMILRAGILNSKNKASTYKSKGEDRAAYKYTSMAQLTARYLGIDIDKDHDLRVSFYKTPVGEHSLRQIVYASGDVVYPYYIAAKQKVLLQERKLENISKIEMGIIPVLADMGLTGVRVDVKKWRELWQNAVKERAVAERTLDELMLGLQPDLFGGTDLNVRPIYTGTKKPQPLNYSSAPQVKWMLQQLCLKRNWHHKLIFTEKQLLDLKAVWGKEWLEKRKDKTVKDVPDWVIPEEQYCILLKADKNALLLAACRDQLPGDVVDLLLGYSKWDIRCDTFGNEFLKKHVRQDTGCMHTEFHQAVTATGRLSSSNPNCQNIPAIKDYRSCFIPKEGYAFVLCDYSQIEPRITAQLSGDPTYSNTFLLDEDLYLAVAEAMLGYRPDKKTPEGKLERKIFKTVVLALAYNMGKWKLRDRLTLALHEEIRSGKIPAPTYDYASELWEHFFEVHCKVRELQTRNINEASPTIRVESMSGAPEYVRNPRRVWDDFLEDEVTWVTAPCGRKRFFPSDAKNCYTEAPNVPPQSGSATITKAAMWLLQQEIDANGWDAHVILSVHDEIVVEVLLEQAAAFAPVMKAIMEKAGQHYCPDIPIKAEFPEGSNGVVMYWAKEVTEEEEAEMELLLEDAA